MLTGYNTDFKFQGKVYHCQTEDGGAGNPHITSLLYLQGAILASRKTSYADILKADCLDEVVRELMMEQHKQMIRDLMKGKLDLNNPPRESTYSSSITPAPEPAEVIPSPPPPLRKETKEKGLDDIILDFLAQEQKDREQNK
jgi:hypothetical protein